MSSRSEKFHEGNAFDGDANEATLSGSHIEANAAVDEFFEEIDIYRDQEKVALADLSDEIDTYREDETGVVEPLDEPIIVIIHS